jgi:outer membrane protein
MNRNHLTAAMVFLLIVGTTATAAAFGMEMAIGGWAQDPSGTLGYKALSSNDLLDVDGNLNYDKERRISGRLSIDMPLFLPNIYLMATPMDFIATGRNTNGFKFGDVTFDPGSFHSETKLDNLDVGLFYGIPLLKSATLNTINIDVGLNVRIYDYKVKIQQDSSGLSASDSGTLPVPMVFLAVQFRPFKRLSLEAEGRGITYSGNDLYSLIGRVKVGLVGPWFVAGGYRYEKVKLDERDISADLEISGPFLETGISF